jgi:hypothetical protein
LKYDKPITGIIEEIAQELTSQNKVPFTRKEIIDCLKSRYPDINEDTVNPMIQGMTINLEGGAPGAIDKNILLSIGTGKFVLFNKENLRKYCIITIKQ